MIIRQENPADRDTVYQVITKAFQSAQQADGNEQDLVNALRQGEAFIPELSLVAEEGGTIVGHILFTRLQVGSGWALALAPLSVLPEWQGKGIGGALIRAGHGIGKGLGYPCSVVLGNRDYYGRFGYRPAGELGILVPEGFPAEHFMATRLDENAEQVRGAVTYAKEFGIE